MMLSDVCLTSVCRVQRA